ncbi:holocytochrome c synthase [Orbilia ellipsospora]|uniref:Holocytochrome c-type synthase n=1 Tax=Orbilia ellipsospora TaxID=2528407 RepID=A0AAV9XFN9_9PEZI
MGWFWADSPTTSSSSASAKPTKPPHHPHMMSSSAEIPPECPMHQSRNLATTTPPPTSTPTPTLQPHSSDTISQHQPSIQTAQDAEPTASRPWSSYLNPLNMMPKLANTPAPEQKFTLPTERVVSSIPKGHHASEGNWEYPSPQQMYNAMLRKGHDDTPEDAVESMVDVHNFLNEGAWMEIIGWEKQFAGSLWRGVKIAGRGGDEESCAIVDREDAEREYANGGLKKEGGEVVKAVKPRLLRFQGRPGDMSPKAKMYGVLGLVFPQFGSIPFDRHDWYVLRSIPGNEEGKKTEVRYVIDYYSGAEGPDGEPVFYLDVRPALDRPRAIFELGIRYGGEFWWKASGGEVREAERRRRQMEKEAGSFGTH